MMAGDENEEFAYLDGSFVLECASVQCSVEQIAMPEWEMPPEWYELDPEEDKDDYIEDWDEDFAADWE